MTAERAVALADILAHVGGMRVVAVRPHCGGRFVLASLAVEARDVADAVDRSAAFLRSSAMAAGIGPLILVAARHAGLRPPRER